MPQCALCLSLVSQSETNRKYISSATTIHRFKIGTSSPSNTTTIEHHYFWQGPTPSFNEPTWVAKAIIMRQCAILSFTIFFQICTDCTRVYYTYHTHRHCVPSYRANFNSSTERLGGKRANSNSYQELRQNERLLALHQYQLSTMYQCASVSVCYFVSLASQIYIYAPNKYTPRASTT